MKNLETLIQELCPDGVEFVKLGDVGTFYGGLSGKSKADFTDGNAKFVTYMNVYSNPALNTDIKDFVKIEEGEKQNKVLYGDVLFTGSSETPNECGMTSVLTEKTEEDLYLNSFCFGYRFNDIDNVNPGFMKHLFRSHMLRKALAKTASGVTRFNVSKKKVANIEIPLPPIEVQTEIVHILDKFTSLEAELGAELDCRKRQYEYYRDKLLSFDNVGGQEVEWKKMSEVSFYPKTRIDASELSDNSYIGVENLLKDKLGRTDSTVKPEGSVIQFVEKDILIGNIRPYLRKIWKSDCKGGTNGDVLCIRVKEPSEVSPDYLFHILSSEKFFLYDIKNSKGAKMPRGDKAAVMDFEIPVPTLEEQNRIVSILNRFESLTTSLQSGLPAEIAARRKQYEHYRDKLLTFKRKGAA
jgi:putative type I restriction enzyme (specificity subunit)